MPYYGAVDLAACVECQAGYYCENAATVTPTECHATYGYYCPESTGADTDRESCTHGHYCPEFAHMEYKCSLGYYSDSTWTATSSNWLACSICEAGSYCIANEPEDVEADNTGATTYSGAAAKTQCTELYFCEEGAGFPQACAEGYSTNLVSSPNGAASEDDECF